jgi:hypothetical protein
MNESRNSQARNGSHDERTMAAIVAEILEDLQQFIQTRIELGRAELRGTMAAARIWVGLVAVALVLLTTAYLLITVALVALVSLAFVANPYRWFLAFLTVGLLWSTTGIVLASLAWTQFKARGMFPKKTVEVLKADKIWLQSQARSRM